jgi:hypothetical protein
MTGHRIRLHSVGVGRYLQLVESMNCELVIQIVTVQSAPSAPPDSHAICRDTRELRDLTIGLEAINPSYCGRGINVRQQEAKFYVRG